MKYVFCHFSLISFPPTLCSQATFSRFLYGINSTVSLKSHSVTYKFRGRGTDSPLSHRKFSQLNKFSYSWESSNLSFSSKEFHLTWNSSVRKTHMLQLSSFAQQLYTFELRNTLYSNYMTDSKYIFKLHFLSWCFIISVHVNLTDQMQWNIVKILLPLLCTCYLFGEKIFMFWICCWCPCLSKGFKLHKSSSALQ